MLTMTAFGSLPARAEEPPLATQLRRVGAKRIYFGHQSVGANIVDGIRDLSGEAGVTLSILEDRGAGAASDSPGLVDAYVGQNTRPLSKIEAFERAMSDGWADHLDVAFFKFCYVDFDAASDVQAIFGRYVQMHEDLKKRYPDVSFVHVTVPLTVTQGGIKGYIKNLVGKAAWGERENVKRHEFNQKLRARYSGKEPLFDLALLESTRRDGSAQVFERDGERFPSLVPEYSNDGEHLNPIGRKIVAGKLVEFLSSLP